MKDQLSILFLLIVIFSVNGCKGEEAGPDKAPPLRQAPGVSVDKDAGVNEEGARKTKEKKEILVSETTHEVRPIWCGPTLSLVYSDLYKGMFLHEVETGVKTKVAEGWNTPLGCTRDGKWLLYLGGVHWDKETGKKELAEIWRYGLSSGKRERFAVTELSDALNIGENIPSPDGWGVFLGQDPGEGVETAEPAWEVVRTKDKQSHSSSIWLGEPRAVVSSRWSFKDKRDLLEVDILTPERRSITLDPGLSEFLLKLTDGQDRVYMKVWDKGSGEARRIVRCTLDLDEESVSCQTVLERRSHIVDFDVFPDNETIAFAEKGEKCVMLMRPDETKAECITTGWYKPIYKISISPDGKWLALQRYNLFVIDLRDN